MNNLGGPLAFDATINDVSWKSQLDAMERRVLGLSNTTVRETNKLDAQFTRLGQLAAGYFSFTALTQLPAQILKVRGEFQQLEIAFTTMLKSKVKQEKLLNDLVQTAATTPFGLKDIANGAKQLLAYGSSANNVVGELRMLGDVASGVSVPINDLVYLYGTLRTQGRAYAVDIRQFAGRGIPIYAELAKVLGVNVDKVNQFVEDGKVGFKEVEQAFKNMTSSGGLFAGLMDAQSKSLLGLKERLADAWDVMLNEIGKKNEGVAAELLETAASVVQNYQQVIDILQIAAATYGTYKAAVLLVSVAQRAQLFLLQSMALEQTLAAAAGEVLTTAQARQVVVSKLLQRAQSSLNATMLANPYILVATALAALVTAYFVLRDEVIQVKSAQELLAESGKSVSTKFREQGSEVKTLIGVIQNQNVAESERLKAYDKLKSISPEILQGLDFQKAKTADLTKELNLYIVSLEKKIRLESAQNALKTALDADTEAADRLKKAQDELIKQSKNNFQMVIGVGGVNGPTRALSASQQAKLELEQAVATKTATANVVKDIESTISGIYTGKSKDAFNAEIARLELVQSTIKDKLSPAYKDVEDKLKALTAQRDQLTASENAGGKAVVKTVDYYDQQIKKLKEEQSANSANRKEYLKYQAQIDAAVKARNRLTGEMTAAEKKAQKVSEKSGPYGSIDYWEAIAKKADEIIQKTASTDTRTLAQQNAIKLDAEAKAEAVRKKLVVKSFDEEIEEKKKKYELYQKWVTSYGKASADVQFQDLVTAGQSFVDYLNTQIALLEDQKANVGLTDKEANSLIGLTDQRNEATGKKTAIEVFKDDLAKAGQQAQNLTDYLDILLDKQKELNPADNSDLAIQKRLALAQEIAAVDNDRRAQLTQYLQAVAGSEENSLAIQKKFADLRAANEKKYLTNRGQEYKIALDQINQDEKNAVKEAAELAAQASEAFKKLDEVSLLNGRAALKKRLADLNEYLKKESAAINTQTYQQKLKERNDLKTSLKEEDLAKVNQFGQLVGELGTALAQLGGTASDVGGLLAGLASDVNLVTAAFKDNLSDADRVQIGLQAAVNIINSLATAAAQRKAKEEEYYLSVIAQQQEYNILLNDQIGLQSKQAENVFVTDYVGRIKDGISQLEAAQKGFQDALKKLQGGQAKVGEGSAVDWGAVGKNAVNGAAIGTAIAPGIGTAIGAGIGAIIGLFGGKKSKDEFGSLLGTYPALIQKSKDGVDELNVALAQTLISQGLVDESTKLLLQDTINWTEQIQKAQDQIKEVISQLAGSLGSDLRDSLVGAFEEGTSSAQAFGDSVSKILDNLLSQLIFNQVFSKQFDQLQKELEASVGPNGDNNWVDDFGRFFGKADELTKLFNEGLSSAQDAAKQYGLDIFKGTGSKATQGTALSGAIKGVTEETASVLAGQINAIRIGQASVNATMNQQLLALNRIDVNTARLEKTNDLLDKMNSTVSGLNDGLRAKGIL